MKINLKFVRFDSTPTKGWNQIFQMLEIWKFMIWKVKSNSIKINLKFDSIRLHLYKKFDEMMKNDIQGLEIFSTKFP